MIRRSAWTALFLVFAGGCSEGETDGAVVRAAWATRSSGEQVFGGGQCTTIRQGSSNDVEGSTPGTVYAFHQTSGGGEVRERAYIRPEGAPPDLELTPDNGELADEYTFERASFRGDEVIAREITTHEDDVVQIRHFWVEDCHGFDVPDEAMPPGR